MLPKNCTARWVAMPAGCRGRVDLLIGVRGAARYMVEAAAQAGVEAEFFEDPVEAGERARQVARSGDAILFKGSRGVKVEKALERFMA